MGLRKNWSMSIVCSIVCPCAAFCKSQPLQKDANFELKLLIVLHFTKRKCEYNGKDFELSSHWIERPITDCLFVQLPSCELARRCRNEPFSNAATRVSRKHHLGRSSAF